MIDIVHANRPRLIRPRSTLMTFYDAYVNIMLHRETSRKDREKEEVEAHGRFVEEELCQQTCFNGVLI